MLALRGLLLDLSPLRGREFRLLFLGQLVSFLGSTITFVALPFQMYDLTSSTLAVGARSAPASSSRSSPSRSSAARSPTRSTAGGSWLAGVEMISYTSGPTLGNFEAGAVASFAGVRASVVSGGVMCVLGTAVLVAVLPAFWRYDARHERVGGAR